MFQELISENFLIIAGWALSGVTIVSSDFQVLLFLQDKLLEWVWMLLVPS